MIQINISCLPDELDAHLEALGFVRNSKIVVTTNWKMVDQEPDDTAPAPDTSPAKEPAAPSPAPRRSTSRARTTSPTPVHPDKPQVSTGEERVDPQDAADEQAETQAAKTAGGGKLTLNDVRQAITRYSNKFSVEAAVADMRALLGCAINDLGEDQLVLAETIGKIDLLVSNGQRVGGAKQDDKLKVAPKTETAEAAADEGLFGPTSKPVIVAEPEPPRATKDEANAAGFAYGKKYGNSVMAEDILKIVKGLFGEGVKNFGDLLTLPGEQAVVFGRFRVAVLDAIESNPFNRAATA